MTRRPLMADPGARVWGSLVAAAVALVLTVAGPAAAHGGNGVLSPESVTTTGSAVEIVVRLTYAGDGHAADGATVTVAGESAAGTALTPVVLTDTGDGRYAGRVELPAPGEWNLRVTAVDPPAQLVLPAILSGPPVTAAPSTAPTTSTPGEPSPSGADPAAAAATPDGGAGDGDGGAPPWGWLAVGVAAAAAVAVGAVFVARGRRP